MIQNRLHLFLMLLGPFVLPTPLQGEIPDQVQQLKPVETILFGSCIKQDKPMPILSQMATEKPDAVIFLGDNIYADTHDIALMRQKYDLLKNNADFQKLIAASPIFATWDDHDFGMNDAGREYPERVHSQQAFLDFWNVPPDSPRRLQEGIYDVVTLGPAGKRIQFILLDTRYFRSPLKQGESRRTGGPYVPDADPEKTMLGEAQWAWLKQVLQEPAEIRILATGIQCIASDDGQETWANLPAERERLLNLIKESKANGLFILSGDRHWSEFSMTNEQLSYPLYDFTSSSFNQIHPRGTPTENRYRNSETTYHQENYGWIKIDWSQPDVSIKVEIRDRGGATQLQKLLKLSELQANK